jgi:hypothetical protein
MIHLKKRDLGLFLYRLLDRDGRYMTHACTSSLRGRLPCCVCIGIVRLSLPAVPHCGCIHSRTCPSKTNDLSAAASAAAGAAQHWPCDPGLQQTCATTAACWDGCAAQTVSQGSRHASGGTAQSWPCGRPCSTSWHYQMTQPRCSTSSGCQRQYSSSWVRPYAGGRTGLVAAGARSSRSLWQQSLDEVQGSPFGYTSVLCNSIFCKQLLYVL